MKKKKYCSVYRDFELDGAEQRPLFEYFEEGDVGEQGWSSNQCLVCSSDLLRLRQLTQMTRQNSHDRTITTTHTSSQRSGIQ